MKKMTIPVIFKSLLTLFVSGTWLFPVYAQTTATDFTVNDCSGNAHHLFAELDAGKVVVFAFVMPCATCISPTLTAYNSAMSFASSHPGRVVFYIADDYANTSCSSLNQWANQYGMSNSVRFSNSEVDMLDYGGASMPKIVVVGGTAHQVYTIQDNLVDGNAVTQAINQALLATGMEATEGTFAEMSVSPNPVNESLQLSVNLLHPAAIEVEIFSVTGRSTGIRFQTPTVSGIWNKNISISTLVPGMYWLSVRTGNSSITKKMIVQ